MRASGGRHECYNTVTKLCQISKVNSEKFQKVPTELHRQYEEALKQTSELSKRPQSNP